MIIIMIIIVVGSKTLAKILIFFIQMADSTRHSGFILFPFCLHCELNTINICQCAFWEKEESESEKKGDRHNACVRFKSTKLIWKIYLQWYNQHMFEIMSDYEPYFCFRRLKSKLPHLLWNSFERRNISYPSKVQKKRAKKKKERKWIGFNCCALVVQFVCVYQNVNPFYYPNFIHL